MNSLPTTEQANVDKMYEVIRKLDPELYLIKLALKEYGLNPMVLPKIIRSISNLATGSGYGKVQVYISNKVVSSVVGEEENTIKEKAIIDK